MYSCAKTSGVVKVEGLTISEIEAEADRHPRLNFFFSNGRLCICRPSSIFPKFDAVIQKLKDAEEIELFGSNDMDDTDFSIYLSGLERI